MTHLFYLLAILFIVFYLLCLVNMKTIHSGLKRIQKIKREKRYVDSDDLSTRYLIYRFISFMFFMYVYVGLVFSSDLIAFIPLILLVLIPIRNLVWGYIDSAIRVLILSFIVLNNYYFQINLFTLLF